MCVYAAGGLGHTEHFGRLTAGAANRTRDRSAPADPTVNAGASRQICIKSKLLRDIAAIRASTQRSVAGVKTTKARQVATCREGA